MPTIVINQTVSSFRALVQALPQNGIFDGTATYRPPATDQQGNSISAECCLEGSTATTIQFQAAVDDAQPGTLLSNKVEKIDQVEAKSDELVDAGFTFVAPSDGLTKGPLGVDENTEKSIERINRVVSEGVATYPQIIYTPDGRGVVIASAADLQACSVALDTRGVYIYGDQVNGDSSSGEAKLSIDIVYAADQAALDAIVDTRT